MSIDIRSLDDPSAWNSLVTTSEMATPFHLAEALDVLADESNTTVHRLVGYKGQEPCGAFPVFTKEVGPITVAFSPPPSLKVYYLGPVLLNVDKLKRRRRELRHSRFLDGCVEWLDAEHSPAFTTVRTGPRYDDVRPFIWNDYEATPRHTYVIDLEPGTDALLESFSSDARRNITTEYDVEYTITEDQRGIEPLIRGATERHAEQGESFPIDAAFMRRLFEELPDGVVRPVVCRCDGEFAGGKILLELGDQAIDWISVADRDVEIPVTDLVDWWYITQAVDRGVESYDLAGANNRRLSRYKSKFAPELTTYYRADRGSWPALAAMKLYGKFR
ncbi:hypothetical protein C461_00202 [Halorubrum aidingense JCM 13560]|uniref:BioF2-like acetyltransferase domain-containing protein n=1 Tax=Halorubrum aidingense JCM 13560 TaxID=1230454 RepID=M0PL56_9EURY|nr:GNAT family N-acetyltransferase [Halorubrum aidingense]EMA70663.1 hypothetical protein C461_00202 [Halorubrum aidingense JCM 13560]